MLSPYIFKQPSKPLKPPKEIISLKLTQKRIKELSEPKKHLIDNIDDYVGPGSYDPMDSYLSTKSKSPSIHMGKSIRFKSLKVTPLKLKNLKIPSASSVVSKSANISEILAPGYSFKRTGHNLKLVENPSFPGVGRYSPEETGKVKGYSFKRSKREFNWKTQVKHLQRLAEFDQRYYYKV